MVKKNVVKCGSFSVIFEVKCLFFAENTWKFMKIYENVGVGELL